MDVIPVKPTAYNYPKSNCADVLIDGVRYFVKIQLPDSLKNKGTNTILSAIPVYTKDTFRGAPDGVYTWIISDVGFFACRVFSYLELGTLHTDLAARTGSSKIIGAGELSKVGDNIRYNLLSGSYTRHIVSENTNGSRNRNISGSVDTIFRELGFDVRRVADTFITKEAMPVTKEELSFYASQGYEVTLYDTQLRCNPVMKIAQLSTQLRGLTSMISSTKDESRRTALQTQISALQSEIDALTTYTPKRYAGGRRTRNKKRRRTRRRN